MAHSSDDKNSDYVIVQFTKACCKFTSGNAKYVCLYKVIVNYAKYYIEVVT